MTPTEAWTCPTCQRTIFTPFCPACGERPLDAHELTLRGLLHHVFHAFSHVDGRFLRSVRWLVTRPGALTLAYLRGQRKPYIGPFPLFLMANVLFFAVQSVSAVKVFSTPLLSHLHGQDWSRFARPLVEQRLAARHTTLDLYAPVFDHAVALNAKSLVILMVLPFALLPPVLFRRSGRPLAAHVAFSLHFYAFLLLLFCVTLVVVTINVWLGGPGLESNRLDMIVSAVNLAVCGAYLFVASGTVYGARGVGRVLKVAALTVAVACIVLGYRFTLFLITLYGT